MAHPHQNNFPWTLSADGSEDLRQTIPADAPTPKRCRIKTPTASMRQGAKDTDEQSNMLLFGESVLVFDDPNKAGRVLVQHELDGYAGYVSANCLEEAPNHQPTHFIVTRHAQIYSAPSFNAPTKRTIPFLSRITLTDEVTNSDYLPIAEGGFIHKRHIWPVDQPLPEHPFTYARRITGAPYHWGGRSSDGLDCSGLIQLLMIGLGVSCPRDTGQQQAHLGTAIPTQDLQQGKFQAGDIIFFKGHVGIMTSPTHLLHANGAHMGCVEEPLEAAIKRGEKGKPLDILAVKRLPNFPQAPQPVQTLFKSIGPHPA